MDALKTIIKLSTFILGCIMLIFTLLVIPVGFESVLYFLAFAIVFFLISYQYSFIVLKYIWKKIKKVIDKLSTLYYKIKKEEKVVKEENNKISTDKWIKVCSRDIYFNKSSKILKINSKEYTLDNVVSIDIIANSKKVDIKDLKKMSTIKNLEIKIGTKIKKVTYKHFKYINNKDKNKNIKAEIKNVINDYKKINKLIKKA